MQSTSSRLNGHTNGDAPASRVLFAFDVYGTLFDTSSILKTVSKYVDGPKLAQDITSDWRMYQLEYSWRLNSMGIFWTFAEVTARALINASKAHGVNLSEEAVEALVEAYLSLDCFADAVEGVKTLSTMEGVEGVIFTNGTSPSLKKLLPGSSLNAYSTWLNFSKPVIADQVKVFKPATTIYHHLVSSMGRTARPHSVYLVSSNPFDVTGAVAAGLNAIWVDRAGKGWIDQLGEPTYIVKGLDELPGLVEKLKY